MENKFPVVSLLIAVAALAGQWQAAGVLEEKRADVYKSTPERGKMQYTPIMGIDRFLAHVEWIRLVQAMGDPKNKMKDNEDGKTFANFYHTQADWITNYRPDANRIYKNVALHISHLLPDKAIGLLQKGMKNSSDRDYELPYYAANIARQGFYQEDDKEKQKQMLIKALPFIKDAVEIGTSKRSLEPQMLRMKARIDGVEEGSISMLQVKWKYYKEKAESTDPGGEDGEPGGYGEAGILPEARDAMMDDARKLALELWRGMEKAKGAEKKKLASQHALVSGIFNQVAPVGHYASASLLSYSPGDFYDRATGTRVKPYGIGFDAYEKKGMIVPLRGAFCTLTGQSATDSAKAWDAWWEQHKDKP